MSNRGKAATSKRADRNLTRVRAQQRQRRLMAIIGGSVLLALIVVIGLVLANRDSAPSSDLPEIVAVTAPDPSIARDGMTIGSPDAPIKLVEYGDYQCPFCAQFNESAMPPLLADYIATGKVQLTFVPFSFLGEESNRAAEAASCAADQGKFWEMHEGIYGNHAGENEGAYSSDRLRQIAANAGLDLAAYDSCMNDGTHEGSITDFNTLAQQAGVTSTPSFTINGGAPFSFRNWDDFKAQLDEALAT